MNTESTQRDKDVSSYLFLLRDIFLINPSRHIKYWLSLVSSNKIIVHPWISPSKAHDGWLWHFTQYLIKSSLKQTKKKADNRVKLSVIYEEEGSSKLAVSSRMLHGVWLTQLLGNRVGNAAIFRSWEWKIWFLTNPPHSKSRCGV